MSGAHPTPPPWQRPPPAPPSPPRTDRGIVVLAALIAGAAGLVIGCLIGAVVVFGIGASGVFDPVARARGPGGDLDRFELGVGQCANGDLAEGSGFGLEAAVPCAQAHDFEVYAATGPPGPEQSDRFPDPQDLDQFGYDYCLIALEAFVDSDYDSNDFDYVTIVPGRAAWEDGDRTVVCALWRSDGEPMVGSARAIET